MKSIALKYLTINLVLAAVVFSIFYFFEWDAAYKEYGFLSYLIIAIASILVFAGVFIALKFGTNKGFIIYLYCALLKNGILLFFCYKYKEITGNLIFYLALVYLILMFFEIVFILKLNRYENVEKN